MQNYSEQIILAAETLLTSLVKIANDHLQETGRLSDDNSYDFKKEDILLLKGVLRFMNDDELALFAGVGNNVSQAVADFLVPRIAPLKYEERIKLGKKMNYHRIWSKIIEIPGLSHDEIWSIRCDYIKS